MEGSSTIGLLSESRIPGSRGSKVSGCFGRRECCLLLGFFSENESVPLSAFCNCIGPVSCRFGVTVLHWIQLLWNDITITVSSKESEWYFSDT